MMLSLEQVAEYCDVSVFVVKKWIENEELIASNCSINDASKKPRLKVAKESLQQFLLARATSHARPKPEPKRKKSRVSSSRLQVYEE